jgi:hypothetical protein
VGDAQAQTQALAHRYEILLAPGTTTITGPIQVGRCRVAADLIATTRPLLRQLHRFQIRPTDPFVGGVAGAVRFEDLFGHLLEPRLAFCCLGTARPGPSDTCLTAAGTLRMVGVIVAHRLQRANPRVARSPAHAQHPRHLSDAAKTDLQRLDCSVAAPVVPRQRTAIDHLRSWCDSP